MDYPSLGVKTAIIADLWCALLCCEVQIWLLVGGPFFFPSRQVNHQPNQGLKKKTWISACPLVNSCHILLSQGHFLFVLVKDFVTGWLACTLDHWKSNQTRITSWILPGPDLLEIAVEFCSVHELSLIHIWRCRRSTLCRSRWSPYH